MCPIVDGTPVDAATTNAQKLDKVSDDTAVGKIGLANVDAVSGSAVTNLQREHNSAASFMGKALNSAKDDLPAWTANNGLVSTDDLFERTDALSAKFDQTTGHGHTGAAGDGPAIDFGDLTGTVSNAQLADMAQSTIKGRAAGAGTGDPQDLTSAQATAILDVMVGDTGSGGTKGLVPAPAAGDATKFLAGDGTWTAAPASGINQLTGDVTAGPGSGSQAATIANDAVTNAKLANMATQTFKGRTTAGTGDPEDLTGTQATAMLDAFTSGLKGLAPASGGGTTNFLRADGTWAAPGGGGGGAAAIYAGRHTGTASDYWSTTSSSYVDPTAAGSQTLTQDYNYNMGTVTTASSNRPGITLTAPSTGTVRVQATVLFQGGTTDSQLQLVEAAGPTTLATSGTYFNSHIGERTLVGYFDVTSTTSYTFTIQLRTAASTCYIGAGIANDGMIGWSVEYVK